MSVKTKNSAEKKKREASQTKAEAKANDLPLWKSLAMAAADHPPRESLGIVLKILGGQYRADRAWIGRYNEARTHFWGVSDWVSPGVPSHMEEMQGVSIEMLGGSHQNFLQGENVFIPDVDRLPRQARSLQAELRREGIRSTFSAPLMTDGGPIGFFGFDYVRDIAHWSAPDFARLPSLAKFLSGLLSRHLDATPPNDLPAASNRAVHIAKPGGLNSIALERIVFIKADGDYSEIHLTDGSRHLERRSLRSWMTLLPRERFLRVHHTYLVNGTHIMRLERGTRWILHLHDTATPIPIGRAFRHALRLHMGF